MRTAAVLPVKRFELAKQRLAPSLADGLRRELAGAMVADVLDALAATRAIEQTIVVTCEPSVTAPARAVGAVVVADTAESGQPAAAAIGIERALAEGAERVLCVPGDCPALDPAELAALLAPEPAEPEVVIVPDRHGTGTNGLLLSPPRAIAPSFGQDSCERHRELARAAGVAVRIERPSSLLLDIDTRADLAALLEVLAAHRAGARRTREVLAAASAPALAGGA